MTVAFRRSHMLAVPYPRRRALDAPVSVRVRASSGRLSSRALKAAKLHARCHCQTLRANANPRARHLSPSQTTTITARRAPKSP
jgi:hypothetical protein